MDRLMKNIVDQIKEAQMKLGYIKETVRLYYPISSLNALLGTKMEDEEGMLSKLREMVKSESFVSKYPAFASILFDMHSGRAEISIPPEGAAYVHKSVKESSFLKDIIELFQTHHSCSLDEIRAIFDRYSDDYMCKRMEVGMDFDYVIHFSDESIDEYYYCIKMEMGHTIYHRFMKEDYELLFA